MLNEPKPEDVMSGLERCRHDSNCDGCPYVGRCWDLEKDALALLREKNATLEMCAETIKRQDKELAQKDAEIERLGNFVSEERCYEIAREMIPQFVIQARAEAITEFAEKLKQAAYGDCTITGYKHYIVDVADVDEAAKEMKGEANEGN